MRSPEPVPPLELAERVGTLAGQEDPPAAFDAYGGRLCDDVLAALPAPLEDAVVLDFGCGAGRLLRHLLHAPGVAELHGCDLDARSVAWVGEHLPRVRAFVSQAEPPLDRPDATFDLVIAVSVFSHLGDSWERWLAELHRVTKPGGVLIATFMGEGMREVFLGPDGELTGMQVFFEDQDWDAGGPMVLHDPAWLREHWAPWFAPLDVVPSGLGAEPGAGQGIYVGRASSRRRPRRFPGLRRGR